MKTIEIVEVLPNVSNYEVLFNKTVTHEVADDVYDRMYFSKNGKSYSRIGRQITADGVKIWAKNIETPTNVFNMDEDKHEY